MSFWPNPNSVSRVQRKYYFFNVDNPDQVQLGTAKPKLTQKGPYCFNGTNHIILTNSKLSLI
jgi:hypothetical protein